jgi:hypothetical protein
MAICAAIAEQLEPTKALQRELGVAAGVDHHLLVATLETLPEDRHGAVHRRPQRLEIELDFVERRGGADAAALAQHVERLIQFGLVRQQTMIGTHARHNHLLHQHPVGCDGQLRHARRAARRQQHRVAIRLTCKLYNVSLDIVVRLEIVAIERSGDIEHLCRSERRERQTITHCVQIRNHALGWRTLRNLHQCFGSGGRVQRHNEQTGNQRTVLCNESRWTTCW